MREDLVFVDEGYIKNSRLGKIRVFSQPRIVRSRSVNQGGEGGVIRLPSAVYLPKELIGKRVKLRIQIIEEKTSYKPF